MFTSKWVSVHQLSKSALQHLSWRLYRLVWRPCFLSADPYSGFSPCKMCWRIPGWWSANKPKPEIEKKHHKCLGWSRLPGLSWPRLPRSLRLRKGCLHCCIHVQNLFALNIWPQFLFALSKFRWSSSC